MNESASLTKLERRLIALVVLTMLASIIMALGIGFILPQHWTSDDFVSETDDPNSACQCDKKSDNSSDGGRSPVNKRIAAGKDFSIIMETTEFRDSLLERVRRDFSSTSLGSKEDVEVTVSKVVRKKTLEDWKKIGQKYNSSVLETTEQISIGVSPLVEIQQKLKTAENGVNLNGKTESSMSSEALKQVPYQTDENFTTKVILSTSTKVAASDIKNVMISNELEEDTYQTDGNFTAKPILTQSIKHAVLKTKQILLHVSTKTTFGTLVNGSSTPSSFATVSFFYTNSNTSKRILNSTPTQILTNSDLKTSEMEREDELTREETKDEFKNGIRNRKCSKSFKIGKTIKDYPFLTSLTLPRYSDDTSERILVCTGSLITAKYVLSGKDSVLHP